ncbi:MAG: pyridoxal phosphate-dependent aminotransferase [Wenzhouxiangellaceae bacterium]
MTLKTSQRVAKVKPSATIAVSMKAAELRAAGRDILSLSMGEPDFDTPAHIGQAAVRAITEGQTRYTAVDGTAALKQAVQKKFQRDHQIDYEANQILVSSGAKQCIYNLLAALLDEGDEVIIPAPYWVSYPDMVRLVDGEPVIINTNAAGNFKITAEQLRAALTAKTRLLILNSPSNPSGKAYTRAEYAALGAVLADYPQVIITSDEIYEHIYWGDEPFASFVSACPQLKQRTVIVNGVSKAYAMTGWRIGYAAGDAALIKEMRKVQSQTTSNPCSISQAAAAAALDGDQDCVRQMNQDFKERHDYFVAALNKLPGVDCLPGDGAFYAFPSFQQVIDERDDLNNDIELANWLLETVGVATVPGSAFGVPGHLRLSYAAGMDTLREAIQRLHQALTT